MKAKGLFVLLTATIGSVTLLTGSATAVGTERVLLSFNNSNGSAPNGSLISDKAGNLYGTTSAGGADGDGTVFKLTPSASGKWAETVLYSFNNIDGANPEGSLVFDNAGNLYGTASNGGAHSSGVVFELSPATNGTWTEKVLYALNGLDGSHPFGSLTLDAHGNLFGTAWQGGNYAGECLYGGCGTVFELTPAGDGTWSGSAIHVFDGADGSGPFSNVIFDSAGNLYGTTSGLLSNYMATAFKLTPGANGEWTETVLYTFNGAGGAQIYSGLTLDKAGSLYGTLWSGGTHATGGVFKLTPGKSGQWTETLLHSFNGKDGSFAYAGVVFDASGNLWGTSSGYGSDLGSVYELIPNGKGQWTISVVNTFHDVQVNGGIAFDRKGNIYSTALQGGTSKNCSEGCGMVFEVTP
jgi:uncharacterized repeat protein (TIGR03803 family)